MPKSKREQRPATPQDGEEMDLYLHLLTVHQISLNYRSHQQLVSIHNGPACRPQHARGDHTHEGR